MLCLCDEGEVVVVHCQHYHRQMRMYHCRWGLPLERLRALGGKDFRGVKGGGPTYASYWLDGVTCILGQMGSSLVGNSQAWYYTREGGLGLFPRIFPVKVHGRAISRSEKTRVHGFGLGYYVCEQVRGGARAFEPRSLLRSSTSWLIRPELQRRPSVMSPKLLLLELLGGNQNLLVDLAKSPREIILGGLADELLQARVRLGKPQELGLARVIKDVLCCCCSSIVIVDILESV
ncbi:hypothetical protein EPI10_027990 [Gossypium australe]|uniref:Uncharacterized protein n=1 Tax=Gossypium australe TaxID=47621 RepID=A0A5B6UVX0_9ROSI|nr:hypothetical protein EPI10_027990 [Gossypium australe]